MSERTVLSVTLTTDVQVSLKPTSNVAFQLCPAGTLSNKYTQISCQNMALSSFKSESWERLTLASVELAQALHLT